MVVLHLSYHTTDGSPGTVEERDHRQEGRDAEAHPPGDLVGRDEEREDGAEHQEDAREEGLGEVVGPDSREGEPERHPPHDLALDVGVVEALVLGDPQVPAGDGKGLRQRQVHPLQIISFMTCGKRKLQNNLMKK